MRQEPAGSTAAIRQRQGLWGSTDREDRLQPKVSEHWTAGSWPSGWILGSWELIMLSIL